MAGVTFKRRIIFDCHKCILEGGCVVQHVRDDIREILPGHLRLPALFDTERFVTLFVVIHIDPRTGIAPHKTRLAMPCEMRRIVPVVGIGRNRVASGPLLAQNLAHDGVLAFADACTLRRDTTDPSPVGVRRLAYLALHPVAIIGEVVVDIESGAHPCDVVEADPVAILIRERLVGHHIVQPADLLETHHFLVPSDIRDLPRMFEFPGMRFADFNAHALVDFLDAEVASTGISADYPAHSGRNGVRNGRGRMLLKLEYVSRYVNRPIGRNPYESCDLPLYRISKRNSEFE